MKLIMTYLRPFRYDMRNLLSHKKAMTGKSALIELMFRCSASASKPCCVQSGDNIEEYPKDG